MRTPPDAVRVFVIFGNPLLINWITGIKTPFEADLKTLSVLGTWKNDNVTLNYRIKPNFRTDPYFGGETGGEIIDIIYPTGQIQLDFMEIAWTSPELHLKHWSCPHAFEQWQHSISTFLENK